MTGKQFRAWRRRLRKTIAETAADFGVSKATISRWELADELPRHVGLTCSAISLNLPPAEG